MRRIRPRLVNILFPLSLLILSGCGGIQSSLNPHGRGSERVAGLWWVLFWVAVAVFVFFLLYLIVAVIRPYVWRRADQQEPTGGNAIIIITGAVIPMIILVVVFAAAILPSMNALSAPAAPPIFTVEVIGHDWWWEVHYLDSGFTTANEIHIPVGKPVKIELTSADVIHSFWVPELQRKMDLIPGITNTTWIEADKAGVYRGQCAEFCGLGHAHMAFDVVADPPDQFATWLADQQRTPPIPTGQDPVVLRGEQVFLGSACVYCHTVKGTNASGKIGPDLTHIMSRQTLAAGTLPNTPGNLLGWIENPQVIKPGNKMPPTSLTGPDLQALLAYLQTLK
jgi:cytochrome c oxidase subunit 2